MIQPHRASPVKTQDFASLLPPANKTTGVSAGNMAISQECSTFAPVKLKKQNNYGNNKIQIEQGCKRAAGNDAAQRTQTTFKVCPLAVGKSGRDNRSS